MTVNAPYASRWITLFGVLLASTGGATEPAYPAHAVDALVAEAISWDNQRALPRLKELALRDELTEDHKAILRDAAFKATYYERQYELYSVLHAAPSPEMLTWAAQHFDPDQDRQKRLEAGYLLLIHHEYTGVPDEIADIAANVIARVTDSTTPAVAARILLAAMHPDANRELQLVNGLVANFAHNETLYAILDELPVPTLELLVRVANDTPDAADWYRASVINHLVARTRDGAQLQDETTTLLTRLALKSDSPGIIEASADALDAWNHPVPLRARVLDRRVQARVLMFVLAVLALVNAATALGGFIAVGVMPLRAQGTAARIAIRSGLVIGWLVLTLVMLVLLLGGAIGFVGAPRPQRIIGFNWPAYIGTVIYIALAWFAYRRGRQAATTPGPDDP